jgi:L-fuconolactonase
LRIDTQVHVVSSDRDAYPLDPPDYQFPIPAAHHWYEAPALGAEDLLGRMDATGIDRAVLVQAYSAYQYDNRYTVDATATFPDRLVCTCIIDIDDDPIADIRYWVQDRGARAIRLFLRNTAPDWLTGPACDDVFTELLQLGVIAQVLAAAGDLPQLLAAAHRHPELPILLDHCALPDLSGGPDYPNATGLFALAGAPNISLKLSNHVLVMAADAGSTHRHIAEALVASFGASRVMWASDYSVVGRVYAECVEEAELAFAGLADTDRALVLGDAAAAMWWPAGS